MILVRARDESRRRGLIWMWYSEVSSAQLTSSCVGEEVLQRKTLLACFLKRWEGENGLHFWKGRKASPPPPSPLQQDCLGKGKWCLAGCTAGVVALEKTCFLLNASCQVRESKYWKGTAANSWLGIAACWRLPHTWFLQPLYSAVIPALPVFTSCRETKVSSIDYSDRVKNS